MTRLEEIAIKVERLHKLMEAEKLDAIYLKRQDDFSWITAGGRNYVALGEMGNCGILVTSSEIYAVTNTVEARRMKDEEKLEEFCGVSPDRMTAADVCAIVRSWKDAVISLDRMLYEDAKKEFSLSFMTAFGADGTREEQLRDFEQVRGDFDTNTFVTTVLEHIEKKRALGDELIGRLQHLL